MPWTKTQFQLMSDVLLGLPEKLESLYCVLFCLPVWRWGNPAKISVGQSGIGSNHRFLTSSKNRSLVPDLNFKTIFTAVYLHTLHFTLVLPSHCTQNTWTKCKAKNYLTRIFEIMLMFEQVFHFSIYIYHRDHPLKTSAFFRGGGAKIGQICCL